MVILCLESVQSVGHGHAIFQDVVRGLDIEGLFDFSVRRHVEVEEDQRNHATASILPELEPSHRENEDLLTQDHGGVVKEVAERGALIFYGAEPVTCSHPPKQEI